MPSFDKRFIDWGLWSDAQSFRSLLPVLKRTEWQVVTKFHLNTLILQRNPISSVSRCERSYCNWLQGIPISFNRAEISIMSRKQSPSRFPISSEKAPKWVSFPLKFRHRQERNWRESVPYSKLSSDNNKCETSIVPCVSQVMLVALNEAPTIKQGCSITWIFCVPMFSSFDWVVEVDLLEVKISLLKTVRCERQEHPSNKRTYKFYHEVG